MTVCADSGLRCTDACLSDIRGSRAVQVTVAAGTAPTENCNLHTFVDYCTEGKCLATDSCPSSSVKQVAVLDFERTEYFRPEGVRIGSIPTDSAKNPDSMFHLIEMKRAIGQKPTPTASGGETYRRSSAVGPCRHDAGGRITPAVALMIPTIPTAARRSTHPSGRLRGTRTCLRGPPAVS